MPDPSAALDEPAPGRWSPWALAGVVLAVLVGVVARFVATSPLWLDEALSVNIAGLPLGDIGPALAKDGHPPLYYWLLHGWMALFGDGDVAVRSMSGVVSLATLPLAWWAGRRLAGRAGGRWAVVLLALSPYAARYATEARMYALVMFLVTAGYLLLGNVLRSPRVWSGGLLALTAGALLWTHYWSVYLLAATGLVLLWRWWRRPEGRAGTTLALVALVAGALSLVPWMGTFLEQAAHTGTPWALPSRPTQILDVTLDDLGGGGFAEASLYGTLIVVLVLLAGFARRTARGTVELGSGLVASVRDEVVVVVATLLLAWAAGLLTDSAYASRYAAVVVPLVLLVAACGLTRLRSGWLLWGLGATAVALGVVATAHNVSSPRTQAEELAGTIAAGSGPADLVVACPDQLGPSLVRAVRRTYHLDLPVVPYPRDGDPRFVDWRDYAERNAAADPAAFADEILERAGQGTIWVVWNGTYRTLMGQCEDVIDRLSASRPATIVTTANDAFEPANLFRFG